MSENFPSRNQARREDASVPAIQAEFRAGGRQFDHAGVAVGANNGFAQSGLAKLP